MLMIEGRWNDYYARVEKVKRNIGDSINIKEIQSTTSLSHGVNCHQERNGPVLPDVVIKSDILGEKDPVLTYLLQMIQ
ncbi:hypothetical protein [Chitinophaga polysaccharea]|uniref:hypothetical protein n=1 Tax=Chitinophaga polysaccharea TaxID=1293035 RepID=UPI001B3B291C|nr:hypothetical protein [Chitinophaga polysaccharea]